MLNTSSSEIFRHFLSSKLLSFRSTKRVQHHFLLRLCSKFFNKFLYSWQQTLTTWNFGFNYHNLFKICQSIYKMTPWLSATTWRINSPRFPETKGAGFIPLVDHSLVNVPQILLTSETQYYAWHLGWTTSWLQLFHLGMVWIHNPSQGAKVQLKFDTQNLVSSIDLKKV